MPRITAALFNVRHSRPPRRRLAPSALALAAPRPKRHFSLPPRHVDHIATMNATGNHRQRTTESSCHTKRASSTLDLAQIPQRPARLLRCTRAPRYHSSVVGGRPPAPLRHHACHRHHRRCVDGILVLADIAVPPSSPAPPQYSASTTPHVTDIFGPTRFRLRALTVAHADADAGPRAARLNGADGSGRPAAARPGPTR
jgi:hypothetical protein